MKIAILGPVVTDRYFGGVATFDEALAEGFEELGHKVRIYTSQQGILSNRQLDIMQLKRSKIVEAVNKEKTDLIIASLQFGTLLKKIQTGRKIYFLHGFFNIQSYGIVKTFAATALTKQMTGYADCVIANSSFTATVNQRICNISVDGVAHLGVDKEFIRNVTPTVERNPKELKRILFVGRLAVSKHVERIIEAVAMLDNSSYELIIVGDGPERVKLEKLAENLKVSARFLGRLEHDKVSDLYKKCGTFIFVCLRSKHFALACRVHEMYEIKNHLLCGWKIKKLYKIITYLSIMEMFKLPERKIGDYNGQQSKFIGTHKMVV